MDTSIRKDLYLEGLGCAHCAAKIEVKVNEIDGVNSASVNFVTKTLTIHTGNIQRLDDILSETKNIINKIEPHVIVLEKASIRTQNSNEKIKSWDIVSSESKKTLARNAAGVIFFGAAFFVNLPYWSELLLYIISYVLIGGGVILRAFSNILKGQVFDENFLMTIATVGAFAIGEYPEGVSVMLFYEIGEFFQDLAVNRSRKSISALMDIRPDFANIRIGDDIKRVDPMEVNIGDIIIVKPGEKIPLDGEVIEGRSMVDTAALTGESVPREVMAGSRVMAGFINTGGVLTIKVLKEFDQSAVARILELVQNAAERKAPTENFITRFARYYTPAVVFTSAALAVIPPAIIPGAEFSAWLYRALVFLVVSCPCALVVSIPLGFFGGIGGASKNGILIKGSEFLEALTRVDTVVFDKTGTLTKGVFRVTDICPIGEISRDELLMFAANAECYSNHPIAASIMSAYGKTIHMDKTHNYQEMPGYGVKSKINGKYVMVGNEKLMSRMGIGCDIIDSIGTTVHVAIDGKYAGYIVISDEIKDDAKASIKALKDAGIKRVIMLTGDSQKVGEKIASELGIDKVYAELLPHEKVEKLEVIEGQGHDKSKVIFAGDGINDAPVLARADIGIAMGALGSDAAIEASDIVIMTDELSKIVRAIKIARRTKSIVWQNIAFALGVKFIVLALGAGGIATMWEAVFADAGVALIAVLNAIRVMK